MSVKLRKDKNPEDGTMSNSPNGLSLAKAIEQPCTRVQEPNEGLQSTTRGGDIGCPGSFPGLTGEAT